MASENMDIQLYNAASINDIEAFNAILDDHPELSAGGDNHSSLQIAALRGCTDIVERILLDSRVDAGAHDNMAIGCAMLRGRIAVVQCLFNDVRVDPSANNNRLLRMMRERGQLNFVELLLSDPRVRDQISETAEH